MNGFATWLRRLAGRQDGADPDSARHEGAVILVGSPNVGKSQLFNRLTGRYVTVSNYPGTTVEVARGRLRTADGTWELVDTPGIYSLNAITAEEQVTCDYLFSRDVRAVMHVVDAKNLERMLPLTLQLAEAGLPLLLVLNMADEAADLGIRIDVGKLRDLLGLPVVRTVATRGSGLKRLLRLLPQARRGAPLKIDYGAPIEGALAELAPLLEPACAGRVAARALALLLLQSDEVACARLLSVLTPARAAAVWQAVAALQRRLDHGAHCYIAVAIRQRASAILAAGVRFPPPRDSTFRERLSRALMRLPIGLPALLAVLYFGLYQFVGVLGAGTLVDALSEAFGRWIMPGTERVLNALLPWATVRELFVGEYGIVPLGLRYALAIVLPIVGTFFLAFSLLEDSGYLPRLAMMIDRVFKRIGLNGRAVIPLVLGFGCGTMATMVTRTLESRRERIIATFLLALAVPCSAQIGVIMGLLARHPGGLLIWGSFVTAIFLLSGWLAARVVPGKGPSFYMELPPLRLPRLDNVMVKTLSRMTWYFREVLPLFILASVLIWIGQLTGIFQFLIRCLEPVVALLGLPPAAAAIFLFGFFRRDYGAAGLYDLQAAGTLDGNQLTVAAVALTLFLPCVAQFLIMGRERGWRTSALIGAIAMSLALGCGWLAHRAILWMGVTL